MTSKKKSSSKRNVTESMKKLVAGNQRYKCANCPGSNQRFNDTKVDNHTINSEFDKEAEISEFF